jgi:hypothetical protein
MSTLYDLVLYYENFEIDQKVLKNLYTMYYYNLLESTDEYISNTVYKIHLIKDKKKRSKEINKYIKSYIYKIIIQSTYFNIYLSGLPTQGKGHLENPDGTIIENQILPIDQESIYDTFEKFGIIESLVDIGYGKFIIKYKNDTDALKAKDYVDNNLIGGKKVRVRFLDKGREDSNSSDIECEEEEEKFYKFIEYSIFGIVLSLSLYMSYKYYPTNFFELCYN